MKNFHLMMMLVCSNLFSSEIVHHVNVISGKLQLGFEDHTINGGVPLSICRTYNSAHNTLEGSPKWNFSQGWNLFPHTHLCLSNHFSGYKAEIMESNGSLMTYVCKNTTDYPLIMIPEGTPDQKAQIKSYRENPLNNKLYIDKKNGFAILTLADGAQRKYTMSKPLSGKIGSFFGYNIGVGSEYKLEKEHSSAGHTTKYTYSTCNSTLLVSNLFSKIKLCQNQKISGFQVTATSSDNKKILYSGKAMRKRYHLTKVEKEGIPTSIFSYTTDDHTNKLWVNKIAISNKEMLSVTYSFPEVKKKWHSYSRKDNVTADYKVQSLMMNGEKLCDFIYGSTITIVRDCAGLETKYHHSKGALDKIIYADNSYETYVWEKGNLVGKTLHNSDGELVFSKTLAFDAFRNVIKETITGDQSYSKWYTYNDRHLCIEEREESGLLFQYEYLEKSDLITCKRTLDGNKVLLEEHTLYDKKGLIKETRSFDGFRESKMIYTRDPKTGLVTEIDNGLQKMYYEYDDARQLIKESSEFASITSEYNKAGKIICTTYPLGGKEEYTYDADGNPIKVKTIGSPESILKYNKNNRPISCEINGRVRNTIYDKKGNIIEEIDYKGVSIKYTYDALGRCVKKALPLGLEKSYEYDARGNVIKEVSPSGFVTKTSYNTFNKPTHIVFADESEIFHKYAINGELKETTYQDGSKISYEYDILNRLISKKQGPLEEYWEYEGVVLKKAINPAGLVTFYEYDQFGRKISEDTEGRKKEFFYDEMGNLTKTQQEDIATTEIFDIEGRVISTHINDCQSIYYEYDIEGRKSRAVKLTSCGEAQDQFFYEQEGRLCRHLDPLNQETLYLYENDSRIEIDPLGNQTVEYFDEFFRVIQKQKLDASGQVVFSEKFFFDKEGNVIRRFTEDHDIEVEYSYNCMNRLVREVESGEKTTCYTYDIKGRLLRKVLPDGVCIDYQYNDLDQVLEMKSSDGTISYEYFYTGMNLTEIRDHMQNRSLLRSYTKFGELAEETSVAGFKTSWYYDTFGRKKQMVLPDNRTIVYDYDGSYMRSISCFSPEGLLLFQHTYTAFDPNGHVEEESLPFNLGTIKSTRDLLERPSEMSSPFHHVELTFGPTSLVLTKTNSFFGEINYQYDSLKQLTKEGTSSYSFDSLGNPTEYQINNLNQIVSSPTEIFTYDARGNLIQRNGTSYTYDALGHLTEISALGRKVTYTYDPLSRLASKQVNDGPIELLFYDQEFEIGKMTLDGDFLELKVLGLGIKGDIGAAIAIEIASKWYVPLHDLQGNIIAITDEMGEVQETYRCNAFGEEEGGCFINPWRFSSKRNEEGLLFFGLRFYDPALKRWITPDPQGFTDSRNLYLYVLNSPLNRLDQFGLEAELLFKTNYTGLVPNYNFSSNNYRAYTLLNNFPYEVPVIYYGSGRFGDVDVEMMVICSRPCLYNLTAQEKEQGWFNFMDKLPGIIRGSSDQIGAIIYMNGINTTKEQFWNDVKMLASMAPQGITIIGLYNPTEGLKKDVDRTFKEGAGHITPNTKMFTAFFTELFNLLDKHDVKAKLLGIPYSGSGATFCSTYENMPKETQKRMQERMIINGLATAVEMPMSLGPDTLTTYSVNDYVTGFFAKASESRGVQVIPSISKQSEYTLYLADHALRGATYTNYLTAKFKDLNDRGVLYVGTSR